MKPMGLLLDSGVNKDLSSRLQKVHQVGSENRFLFDAAELPTRCRFEGVLDEVHPFTHPRLDVIDVDLLEGPERTNT